MYADSLTGAPADHGVRPAPPADAEAGEEEAAAALGGGEHPPGHVEIEKSNVLILVSEAAGGLAAAGRGG